MTCDYIIPAISSKDRRKAIIEALRDCHKACTNKGMRNFVMAISEDYFTKSLCFTKAILNNKMFVDSIAAMFKKQYSEVGVKFMVITGDAYSYDIHADSGLIE